MTRHPRGDAVIAELRAAFGSNLIRGAEIGVWKGHLSEYLLTYLPNIEQYLMVDRWVAAPEGSAYWQTVDKKARADVATMTRAKNMATRLTNFAADRRRILRLESGDAAMGVAEESLDFVFIDADHSHYGVSRDLRLWYPKLRPGGIMSGHDIDQDHLPDVTVAVGDWLRERGFKESDLRRGLHKTYFVRKPREKMNNAH